MFKYLRTLYRYNLQKTSPFLIGLLLIALGSISENTVNVLLKYLVDAIGNKYNSYLINILLLIAFVKLLAVIFNALAFWVSDISMSNTVKSIRVDAFNYLHKLDFSFHTENRPGALISAFKRGESAVWNVNHVLNREILPIIIDFIFIVVLFWTINPIFLYIIMLAVVLDIALTSWFIKYNIPKRQAFNDQDDEISHIVTDNMINYDTVKYFAKEDWENQRLLNRYHTWFKTFWGYANSFRMIDISAGLLVLVSSVLTIGFAIYQTILGHFTTGELVLVISFVSRFFPQLINVIYRLREVAKHFTDLETYLKIFEQKITVQEKANPIILKQVKGKIEFENVGFSYKSRQNVIKNLNLTINPGQSVAFVGESGAGKTTLTRLLLRFYDVTSGAIKIDGHNIKDVSKKSLRINIGIVPQDPIMFNDSIAYNIRYGTHSDVSEQQIHKAAQMANLAKFIESLPQGYDTVVGERGIKLSGGQRQRLAIARMFITNPPIIVFDEATSQLDSKSEKLIQQAFWKLAKNRTTIIIAHRLSTVMKAERIIVIDDGQLIQQGTHQDLTHNSGIYQTLWKLQQGSELEE